MVWLSAAYLVGLVFSLVALDGILESKPLMATLSVILWPAMIVSGLVGIAILVAMPFEAEDSGVMVMVEQLAAVGAAFVILAAMAVTFSLRSVRRG